MMKQALLYGLTAAVCFGVNAIFYKLATSGKSADPYLGMLLYCFGIFAIGLLAYLFLSTRSSFNWACVGYGLAAGLIWGVGALLVALGFSKGVPASLMVPLYSTNALITVLLGIFCLKEIPDTTGMIKLIIGTVLIVIGGIIVSI